MQLHVHKKSTGQFIVDFELPNGEDATVSDLKEEFYLQHHYYTERQLWYVGSPTGLVLKEGLLKVNGVQEGTTLYFKDLGVQISWRLVFFLEYLGPLLIIPLILLCRGVLYDQGTPRPPLNFTQQVTSALLMLHFMKREVESLFVHRFSHATMPLVRLPLNCLHYWGFCGLIAFNLFHPAYKPPFDTSVVTLLAGLVLIFELLNGKTHLILRSLRPRGTAERGIPCHYGFDQVSCANYFWEFLVWMCMSAIVNLKSCWLFTIVAALQMTQWALKKHSSYRATFKEYPRNRKAIIPFVI